MRDASSRIVTVSVPAEVDHLAARLRPLERAHDPCGRVVHVREGSRLLPVAVDLHRLAVEERLDERDDRPAPPAEVVARPVRVEEPEDRDSQVALVGEREPVVLVVHLRDGVGPALRGRRADHELAVLGVRRCAVPVHVGGRREDQVGVERQCDRAGRLHALRVHVQRRVGAAEPWNLLGRRMDDRVAAREGAPQLALVRAVEHLELEARVVEERRDVRHRAVREIVDPHDLVVLLQQLLADVRADEPGRAGDPDLHAAALSCLGRRSRIPGRMRCATPVTPWPLTISG